MALSTRKWRSVGMPGAGALCALVFLLLAEASLHSDAVMHRLRSVFAVGRAFDKVMYVEQRPPQMLVLGNSRTDNGVDPATLAANFSPGLSAFNLGLPGANATALFGIAQRLDGDGLLGPDRIQSVLIGLDEGLLQAGDLLGYEVFFVVPKIWNDGFSVFLRSQVRLWGYADNLKQLREPAKLIQFLDALRRPVEPIGGGAAERLGYRPGFGENQDAGQVARQEAGSTAPPDEKVAGDFRALLDLLEKRKVQVAVIFPPLLGRKVLYLEPQHPGSKPYLAVRQDLSARDIPMFALAPNKDFSSTEFVNAGHLNDAGAQRFSVGLALALGGVRGEIVERVELP